MKELKGNTMKKLMIGLLMLVVMMGAVFASGNTDTYEGAVKYIEQFDNLIKLSNLLLSMREQPIMISALAWSTGFVAEMTSEEYLKDDIDYHTSNIEAVFKTCEREEKNRLANLIKLFIEKNNLLLEYLEEGRKELEENPDSLFYPYLKDLELAQEMMQYTLTRFNKIINP